jgi:NAD(P)-dependent dehydrogenase (short-subunit alcohol dehydrogenase family)
MQIKDSVVLITGANRGIGAAFVKAFRDAGASKVYAASRSLEAVGREGVTPIKLDVTEREDIRRASEACRDVTIIVNNAGILAPSDALADDVEEAFARQVEVNVLGPVRLTRAFAPILKANGGGAVVTMHSVLSWLTVGSSTAYSASKAAIWAFTNGIRTQLAQQNTEVIGVHVGFVDTDMTAGIEVPKVTANEVAAQVLLGIEAGSPEVLVDDTTRAVKASFCTDKALYLYPPAIA